MRAYSFATNKQVKCVDALLSEPFLLVIFTKRVFMFSLIFIKFNVITILSILESSVIIKSVGKITYYFVWISLLTPPPIIRDERFSPIFIDHTRSPV